jgi:hypothetical protein
MCVRGGEAYDRRPVVRDFDSFAFGAAAGALGAASLAFVATANGAALVMCAICLTALVAGRALRVSGGVLLLVAVGICGLLWLVWVSPVDRYVSPTAHMAGGALIGWAIAETLRSRGAPSWPLITLAAVLVLTLGWELGEYVGDRVLDTALIPNKRDSAYDVAFGCLGGVLGVVAATLRPARRPGG